MKETLRENFYSWQKLLFKGICDAGFSYNACNVWKRCAK